jgi:pimeloyl-ACP methyl ester carboxylesterase
MQIFGKRHNPPLLLLHGIGTGHRLWLRQIERFEPSHFVMAPDLRGFTGAGARDEISILAIAKHLADELAAQAMDDVSVCGISAGASVALALALCGSQQISRLVLSAPQARAPRLMLVQIAISSLLSESMIVGISQRAVGNDPEIAQATREDFRAMGKERMLSALRSLKALDLRAELPKIETPSWIFCGGKDTANLPAARAMARLMPNARLHIEPGAGHLWNVQMADRFNDALGRALHAKA